MSLYSVPAQRPPQLQLPYILAEQGCCILQLSHTLHAYDKHCTAANVWVSTRKLLHMLAPLLSQPLLSQAPAPGAGGSLGS